MANNLILAGLVLIFVLRLALLAINFYYADVMTSWVELKGERIRRGKGLTLLVQGVWVSGRFLGCNAEGQLVLQVPPDRYLRLSPESIEDYRVYDL